MGTTVQNTDRYPATPAKLQAMLRDPQYLAAKYEALGDLKHEVTKLTPTDTGLELVVDREVPSNMPDLAKKVLGETNRLVQRESWRADGDSYVCDFQIDSPGKPLNISGTMRQQPVGAAESDWIVKFDIKASVPLVGGKIEKMVAAETRDNLTKEYAFNKQWLAQH